MAADKEQHSVRVEVEVGPDVAPIGGGHARHSDGGAPKWIVALSILVLGVLGAVVLLLQPEPDTAADGRDREPAELVSEDTESTVADISDDRVGEVAQTSGAIVPTRVLLGGGRAIQIIAGDLGFFALLQDIGTEPSILRSVDGEDWFEVNSTVTSLGRPNEERLDWFALSITDDRFVLRAAPVTQDSFPSGEVFTSPDGVNWQQLDGFGSLADGPASGFPVAFSEGSSFSFEFTGVEVLADFLERYTTLELPEEGVCGITAGASVTGETIFNIGSCSGGLVGPLDASGIQGEIPAGDVFACMNDLSDAFSGTSLSFVRRAISGGNRAELFTLRPAALPLSLSNGIVVVPDAGPIETDPESCSELIDLPAANGPGMVVVDASSDRITRWAFPDGATFEGERFVPVQPVSEFVLNNNAHVLLTVFDEALWGLDLGSGQWSGPLTQTPIEQDGLGGTVTASTSGDRVYFVDGAALTVLEIFEDSAEDGSIVVSESSASIDVSNAPAIEFGGEILYADDDIAFVSDGVAVWTIELPERIE